MIRIFEPLDFKDAKPRRPQQAYVVKPGDTLAGIALRHGMKEAEVRAMNNLWEGNVFAGQQLVLHRKKRSQSLPALSGAKGFGDGLENAKESAPRRKVETTNQADEDPAQEEERRPSSPPTTQKNGSSLDVILEQSPQVGFFGALFGGLLGSEVSKKGDIPKTLPVTKSTRAPRLKVRSYSERLPTNQEEQDEVYALPKLRGALDTDILSEGRYGHKLVPKIEAFLPMSLRGYDWTKLYSLSQHGSSLQTLMRKVHGQRATIVVVETCKGEVFGGFVRAPWTKSLSYYGSGESFVFTNVPAFEVFNWKRTNSMFMFSNDDSIAMGGGGSFAWFLNSDLSRGTTGISETFGNRPLATESYFDIANVEVWGFEMF